MSYIGQKNAFFNLPPWLRQILEAPASAGQQGLPPGAGARRLMGIPERIMPGDATMAASPGMGPGPGPVGQMPEAPPPPPPQMTYGEQERGVNAMRDTMFGQIPASMGRAALLGNIPGVGAAWDAGVAGIRTAMDPSVVGDPNDPMGRYHMHLRDEKRARGLAENAPPMASAQEPWETGLDLLPYAGPALKGSRMAVAGLQDLGALPFGAVVKGSRGQATTQAAVQNAREAAGKGIDALYNRLKPFVQRDDFNQDTLRGAVKQYINAMPETSVTMNTDALADQIMSHLISRFEAEKLPIRVGPSAPGEIRQNATAISDIDKERAARLKALEAVVGKPAVPPEAGAAAAPPSPTAVANPEVGMSLDEINRILGTSQSPPPPAAPTAQPKAGNPIVARGALTGDEPDFVQRLQQSVKKDQSDLERGVGKLGTDQPVSPVPMPEAARPAPAPETAARYNPDNDSFVLPPRLEKLVQVQPRIHFDPETGKTSRAWAVTFKDPKGNVLATSQPLTTSQEVIARIEGIVRGTPGFNAKEWKLRPGTSPSDANTLLGVYTELGRGQPKATRVNMPNAVPGTGTQAPAATHYNVSGARIPMEPLNNLMKDLRAAGLPPVEQKAKVMEFLRDPALNLNVNEQAAAAENILGKLQPKTPVPAPAPTPGNAAHPVPPRAPLEPGERADTYSFGGEGGVRLPRKEIDSLMARLKETGSEKSARNKIAFYLEKAKNMTPQEKAFVADRLMARWQSGATEVAAAPKPPTTGTPPVKLPDMGPRPGAAPAAPTAPVVGVKPGVSTTGEQKQYYTIAGQRVPVDDIDKAMSEPDMATALTRFAERLTSAGVKDPVMLGDLMGRFARKHQETHAVIRNPTGALPAGKGGGAFLADSPVGVPSQAGKPAKRFNPKTATTTDILNELGGGGDNMDRPYAWYTQSINGLIEGGADADQARKDVAYIVRHAKDWLKLSGQQITQMDLEDLRRQIALNRTLPKVGK